MKSIWTIMLNVLVRIGQLAQCATRVAKRTTQHMYRVAKSAAERLASRVSERLASNVAKRTAKRIANCANKRSDKRLSKRESVLHIVHSLALSQELLKLFLFVLFR